MLTLTRCTVYFLVTVTIFLFLRTTAAEHSTRQVNEDIDTQNKDFVRTKRAIGKPGFFWTFASSIFQTFNETRSAYQQIRQLLNDQFIDEKAARTKVTTTPAPGITTTTEAYKISRKEFNRIIMRNLRGLVRLYNIELDMANKQSKLTQNEFNQQLRVSIKKELS